MLRLNLGCGERILEGYQNVDKIDLPGVDQLLDLSQEISWFAWDESSVDEIIMSHVLEHLPDSLQVMERIWKICKPMAIVKIRVPFWNSHHAWRDITHIRTFTEKSFDYFDPSTDLCKKVGYYTKARFRILKKNYLVSCRGGKDKGGWYLIRNPLFKAILEFFSTYFSGVIYFIDVELQAIK